MLFAKFTYINLNFIVDAISIDGLYTNNKLLFVYNLFLLLFIWVNIRAIPERNVWGVVRQFLSAPITQAIVIENYSAL